MNNINDRNTRRDRCCSHYSSNIQCVGHVSVIESPQLETGERCCVIELGNSRPNARSRLEGVVRWHVPIGGDRMKDGLGVSFMTEKVRGLARRACIHSMIPLYLTYVLTVLVREAARRFMTSCCDIRRHYSISSTAFHVTNLKFRSPRVGIDFCLSYGRKLVRLVGCYESTSCGV
jgi:hypothetical protein